MQSCATGNQARKNPGYSDKEPDLRDNNPPGPGYRGIHSPLSKNRKKTADLPAMAVSGHHTRTTMSSRLNKSGNILGNEGEKGSSPYPLNVSLLQKPYPKKTALRSQPEPPPEFFADYTANPYSSDPGNRYSDTKHRYTSERRAACNNQYIRFPGRWEKQGNPKKKPKKRQCFSNDCSYSTTGWLFLSPRPIPL